MAAIPYVSANGVKSILLINVGILTERQSKKSFNSRSAFHIHVFHF